EQEWTVSAQVTNSKIDIDYNVTRTYEGDTLWMKESSANKSVNQEITFQSDYTHPFSKKFTLETGAKSIIRDVKSDYNYEYSFSDYNPILNNITQPNNIFNYT